MRPGARSLWLVLAITLVPATVNAQTTLSASPTSVIVSGTVTATWSGIPAPSASNWLGLFTPGAASNGSNLYSYRYTNGAAGGSVPFILPTFATPGTYELRLFSSSYTLLATSNSFTVVAPPSVSGTVTSNGAGLSGVVFTASNGGTCTSSNGSGQYNCTVPPGWSGSVTPSRGGVSFTPASRDYSNVTASQSAQSYAGVSTATLSVSPTSAIVNGTVTATWSGTPGPTDGNWLGLYKPGDPSSNFYLYSRLSVSGQASGSVLFTLPAAATPGTYELRLFSSGTYTVLAISNSFTVVAPPSVSGTVTLNGAGLSGVVFTASNGGTCTTSNGSGQYSCTVPPGWSGSVTPSRGGVSLTPASRDYSNVTASQSAQNYAGVSTATLSVSPTGAIVNGTVTATWSGTPGTADGNWLGLYKPGDPSSNFYLYGSVSVSGQASGSVLFTLPAAATPGTYELRLFSSGTYTALAISNSFTVSALVSVSGTVTAAGSPLSGVAFAASNGGTCTTSNASGQYSCTVPVGWTGSVTPTLSGYSFTPAARSYSALQLNQTAQDFAATAAALAIYYIVPDHLNTPRSIADSTGTTVWRWDQGEPFGNDVPNDNPSGLGAFDFPLRFPGQYFDRETSLAYNNYRDYDPGIGRYIQSDPVGVIGIADQYGIIDIRPLWALPINPIEIADDETIEVVRRATAPQLSFLSDFNLYAYVRAAPLIFGDPLGLAPAPPPGGGKPTIPPPQGPPPDAPPPPGFGCSGAVRLCIVYCIQRCPGGRLVKGACLVGCGLLYIACLSRGK